MKYDVSFLKDSLKSEVIQVNYDSLPQAEVPTIIYDMLSLKDSNFSGRKANHKGLRFGLLKDGKVTQLYNSFSDCVIRTMTKKSGQFSVAIPKPN